MNNSPQDLLQLAPTVSDMSLIGYNRTSLSTSRVDLCYLMPSAGAPTLMAQRGARSTGLSGSSSQAWLQHLLSPWEFFTLNSPTCRKDDSSSPNHKQVLMLTYGLASSAVTINWNFSKCWALVLTWLFWSLLPNLNRLRAQGCTAPASWDSCPQNANPQLYVLSLRLIKYFQPHLDEVNPWQCTLLIIFFLGNFIMKHESRVLWGLVKSE